MDDEVTVDDVKRVESRSGNTRWVLRTTDGREFTTFRPRVGEEAAPWVLGSSEPEREIPPEELYEKLEPFKRRVSEDIRRHGDDD